MITAVILTRGIAFNEERFGHLGEIPQWLAAELQKFSPVTIAHRGGNNGDNFRNSISCGVDLIEADIRSEDGVLAVSHEQYLGPIALDRARKYFRLGGPQFSFDKLTSWTSSVHQGMFLDLKGLGENSLPKIQSTINKYGVENLTYYSTNNWKLLDKIGELQGRNDHLFYTVGNRNALEKFLEEQRKRPRLGVSIDESLVDEESVAALKAWGVTVFAYVVHWPGDGLRLLESGVDGLISNNLDLLAVFTKPRLPGIPL